MTMEKVDYAALLAELEAKKAALEASIASIRSAMALGVLGRATDGAEIPQVGSVPNGDGMPVDLPRGALHGKSIPQAIKLYLSAVKKRQTNKQITEGLQEHGIVSSGQLEDVVTGALNRMKKSGELLRFNDGWGLAEWTPESLRSKVAAIAKAQKPAKNKGNKRKKREPKVATKGQPGEAKPHDSELSTEDRIVQLLENRPTAEFSPQEVIAELGIRPQTVHFLMGKMAHFKKIDKTPSGKFRAIASNVREMAAV